MTPDFKAHPDGESSSLQAKTNKTHHSAADSFSPLAAKDLIRRLRECLALNFGGDGRRGAIVWERDDDTFKSASSIFNGAVKKTHALALVQTFDAIHVSKTIVFCREHGLELSVKGGGTGVHGWSLAGDIILDLSLMTDISMTLPNASASTLQESFERLHLHPSPISSSYSESRLDARRPSLVAFQASSSGSFPTSSKRTALDAGHDGGRDRRDGADSIDAWGKRKMRTVGEGGCDRPHSGSSSDHDADRDMEMSRSSSVEGHRSGSGSRSGVESHGERSTSTLATSLVSSPDGVLKAQAQSGMSDGDGTGSVMTSPAMLPDDRSPQTIQPRTTYVNPSPTATLNSFPFVSSSFSTASSSSSYPISVEQAYLASFRAAKFNTHPNPPPFTLVTFGAGTHSKQLDAATAASEYGAFHVPSSAYPVGSGQFLAGGFGFIGRKHGLAMDNLVEAELVLADGRIVWVGEGGKSGGQWRDGEDPEEVWWGLRGAGAVLGVITRFRAKAFYLPSVYAGNLIYMFDRTTSPSLLRHLRDCIKGAPRTVYTNFIMTSGPKGGPAIVVIQLCFSGSRAEGELYLQAMSSWDEGKCLFQDFCERSFEKQQLAVEEVVKGGDGKNWFIKSAMLKSLTDAVIDQSCDRFSRVPDGCTWLFEYTGGGAISDVKNTCFPMSHRDSSFTVAALHQWGHGETVDHYTRSITSAEEWINEVIHPNSPGGPLPCFLESATEEAVSQVYGENYPRLVKLKSVIDPKNVFRHAMWPRPDAPNDRRQVGEKNPEVEVDTSKADVSARTADGPSASDGIPDKGKARAVGQADIFESLTSTSDQVPPAPLSELTAAVEQAAREKRVPTGMTVPAVNASDTVM